MFQSSHMTNTKNEGSEGKKSSLSKIIHKTLGTLGLLCTHKATAPSITREETSLTWNITRTQKNFRISPWLWKVPLYIQWNTQGSPYHPSKETTWAFWGQRKQYANSWVKGGGGEWYLTTQEFLNRFSNKTNHWLFISKDQGEVTLTLTSHLCCFPSTTARALFKFTSEQSWKYKQTLFLSLVWSQAIKQALEISNLSRKLKKKKKKNLLRQKSKTLIRVSSVKLSINDLSPK